jgi:uncharacterized RDD family membrane protein YckC
MPLEYAAPWKRGAAFLLDVAIVAPLGWLVSPAVALGVGAIVSAVSEGSAWQRSAGKAALGMKLIEHQGRRPGYGRAAGRSVLKYWSLFLCLDPWMSGRLTPRTILYLLPLLAAVALLPLARRRRTWWDRVCGTSVISLPPSQVKATRQTPDRA